VSYRLRHAIVVFAAVTASVVACTAILGVEDVKLRKADGGKQEEDAGEEEDTSTPPDEDAGPRPRVDDAGSLALGFLHACARSPAGTVRCWGDNGAGQLGDGLAFDSASRKEKALSPEPVQGIANAVAIGAGLSHTCVVHADGKMSCWGLNSFGQLGDGTTERSSKPVPVRTIVDAVAVVGGSAFTCALRKDKTVLCWGLNIVGQIGDGTKVDKPTPTSPKLLTTVVAIGAGNEHGCAALENGDVKCWGKNNEGQLGIGSNIDNPEPTKVVGMTDAIQVAGAARFTCARQKAGAVYCWGNNEYGQLGTGTAGTSSNKAVQVTGITDAVWIWTGYDHACAVKKDESMVCWGRGKEGQLGFGSEPPGDGGVATPVAVTKAGGAYGVWTGGDRSCALSVDGRAFCWGANSLGQLGNGTTERAFSAVPVKNYP
jgi:alpha-tubulin suppressor-like RCC1 family protein